MNSSRRIPCLLLICFVLLASESCRNAANGNVEGMSFVTNDKLPAGVKYEVVKSSLFSGNSTKEFDSRYEALLGDLPKKDYIDWKMKAGSRLDTVGAEPPRSEDRFAQFLVEFVNDGTATQALNVSAPDGKTLNLGLKLPNSKVIPVWEFLASGMFSNYASIKNSLSRHGEKVALNLSFEGQLYCDLAPGQHAWLAILFRLPSEN